MTQVLCNDDCWVILLTRPLVINAIPFVESFAQQWMHAQPTTVINYIACSFSLRPATLRMWMHTPRPRLLCFRWWQWWQSRAKWHPGTWTGAPRVGYELPWRQHGRWQMSWTESGQCCSRRWETSPWRHPSSLESVETEGRDKALFITTPVQMIINLRHELLLIVIRMHK